MAKFTNISTGPRGLHTTLGLLMVEKGETADVALAKDEEANEEWFSLDGDPLDHDQNGKKGGARQPETVTDDAVASALTLLDPTNNDHWTAAGLPAVEAVEGIAQGKVTREQIAKVAPDFNREKAQAQA